MQAAIALSEKGLESNLGGPFGAVIVKDGEIVGKGHNQVTGNQDPTAHAEINAIRDACKNLGTFQLNGCVLYTSCEPCPMCLGAIYWARLEKVYYACSRYDAAKIDFDDEFIYKELEKPLSERRVEMNQLCREEALGAFEAWKAKEDRAEY